ncbi:MAG: hypothetical protein H6519_09200 [Microthrixaceae bacterium]|nr:hypothetical protein [Microthrixaceae bacterium]
MIDYEALDGAIGHNWYELDPMLTDRVKADCPPDSFGWVDAKLRDFGGLVGGDIARNADVIDANPPQLVRYDRWSGELGRVDHPGATIDSSASCGPPATCRSSPPTKPVTVNWRRVMLAAANYLLSQADTGMVCSLGMTSGWRTRRRLRPRRPARRHVVAFAATTSTGRRRLHVPHRTRRWIDLGRTVTAGP